MLLLRPSVLVCLALFFGLLPVPLPAQTPSTFTTVVVFGDSLSDTGNIAHLTQSQYGLRYPADNQVLGFDYTDGRFTDGTDTQPAASTAYTGVWIEQLAKLYTVAVKDSLDGGTNYAYGDATTGSGTTTETKTYLGVPLSITLQNMGGQVTTYLATNPAPNAQTLYVLWGGANDIYNASDAGQDPSAAATVAAQNELALVQSLVADGAINFMLPNLPPLGGVPSYASGSTAAALNTAAQVFAQVLAQGISSLKLSAQAQGKTLTVYQPDIYTRFITLAGTPMSVGLSNVLAAAQGISGSPDTYLIWDGLHPTTTGHHFVAASAADLITPLVASATTSTAPAYILTGQALTVSAKVSSTASARVPTGLVSFFSGVVLLGSAALDATGTATVSNLSALSLTSGGVRAVYAGDTTFNPSYAPAQMVVVLTSAVSTSTSLSSSNLNANLNSPVTFTATVTPSISSYGTPAGTVTFLDGTTTLGTGTLSNGVATYTTSSLGASAHSITASYPAAGLFAASTSTALTETVTAPAFTPVVTPTSLSISGSGSGTVMLSATSVGGFSGSIGLSCGSLPAHFTCAFSMATYSVCGSCTVLQGPVTLTIGTAVSSSGSVRVAKRTQREAPVFLALLGTLLTIGLQRGKRRRGLWLSSFGAVLLLGGASLLSGCGGSPANVGSGTYTIPVVFTPAASGGTTVAAQTVNVSVTVQ